jgi:hypothetical protein
MKLVVKLGKTKRQTGPMMVVVVLELDAIEGETVGQE